MMKKLYYIYLYTNEYNNYTIIIILVLLKQQLDIKN